MVGVSAAMLRAWEREGLIHPVRSATGYRRFSIEDLELLRVADSVKMGWVIASLLMGKLQSYRRQNALMRALQE